MLSVPGNDPHRIGKALASDADQVVIDLEDAVAVGEKDAARGLIASASWWHGGAHPRIAVRVNAIGSVWGPLDLAACAGSPAPIRSVVLPKSESRADVRLAESILERTAPRRDLSIEALIETAAGVAHLADIVSSPGRLSGLIVGYADLAASIGRRGDLPGAWRTVQDLVLIHARSARIEAIDGPCLGVADDEGFREEVRRAVDLGFDGKWVIHPRQIAAVNAAFTPDAEAVAHARRLLGEMEAAQADGRGALQLDGQLVDEAMAVAARRTLAKAGR